jgi:hypothetical protein
MAAEREKAKKHKTFNEIEKRKVPAPHSPTSVTSLLPALPYPTPRRSVTWANAVVQRVQPPTCGFLVSNDPCCAGTVEDEKRVLRQMGGN